MFLVRNVTFGTQYLPSSKKILTKRPTDAAFQSTIWSRSETRVFKEEIKLLPSYSMLDGCISDKTALLHWQKAKILLLGKSGFMKWIQERAQLGRSLHKSVEDFLERQKTGKTMSQDELLSHADEKVHGFVQSIYPYLVSLKMVDCLQEGTVTHAELQYTGRFDAVLQLPDGPCMIDWKTAEERSAVSVNYRKGEGLKGLYGYPKQIAAYVGAFNSDPSYRNFPPISRGRIVLAYGSGAEAIVAEIPKQSLEDLWSEWTDDLRQKFWRRIDEGETDFRCTWETINKKNFSEK